MPSPRASLLYLLLGAALFSGVSAQSCENYGTSNGSSCACPPGFGGSTCSTPGCGGDIFQGAQRPLAQQSSTSGGSSFANLTASGCSCESGWGGFGCNVCQSASACQSAYTSAGGSTSSTADSLTGTQNTTLTCNTSPRVHAANQMSCNVIVSASYFFILSDMLTLIYLQFTLLIHSEPHITGDFPCTS